MDEYVDILAPPLFERTGHTKPLHQAWRDGDWIGTFNLWIINACDPAAPCLIYQQRSMNSSWEPGKLDVTAGGHYSAGETVEKGLREVREELGRDFRFDQLHYLGRKVNVSPDRQGWVRNNIVDVCMVIDNAPLLDYHLEENEVSAIFLCPIHELVRVHTIHEYKFMSVGLSADGKQLSVEVSANSFPKNWDNYHFKVAILALRLMRGDEYLIY